MTCCTQRTKYRLSFLTMIILTLLLCLAKVFVGYKENSLSLIAESFHLTSDFAALIVGYVALHFSEKKGEGRYTFGRVRAEILGAMINAIFLVAICFSLSVESLKRLVIPDPIDHPMPVLIVGIISLFINTIGLVLFRCSKCRCDRQETKTDDTYMSYPKFTSDVKMDTDAEECPNLPLVRIGSNTNSNTSIDVRPSHELNIFAVFLHILQHVFVALIVITSALIVMFAKGSWTVYIDPSLSLVVVMVMLKTSLPLMRACIVIFMQAVPANLQLKNTEERLIQKVEGVIGVHELHIWQLAGDQIVGSAHIVFKSLKMYNENSIKGIKDFFLKEGISSLTIQPEFSDDQDRHNEAHLSINSGKDCLLLCAEKKCALSTCCETPMKMIERLNEELQGHKKD